MLTRRSQQANPMAQLRAEVDRLMSDFFSEGELFPSRSVFGLQTYPSLNIWEDEQNVYVECEVPGVSEKDIDISVTGRELTIRGQRPALPIDETQTVLRRERGAGTFSRVIDLPVEIDEGNVDADLANGVLTITLAKADESRTRRIQVKSR